MDSGIKVISENFRSTLMMTMGCWWGTGQVTTRGALDPLAG